MSRVAALLSGPQVLDLRTESTRLSDHDHWISEVVPANTLGNEERPCPNTVNRTRWVSTEAYVRPAGRYFERSLKEEDRVIDQIAFHTPQRFDRLEMPSPEVQPETKRTSLFASVNGKAKLRIE